MDREDSVKAPQEPVMIDTYEVDMINKPPHYRMRTYEFLDELIIMFGTRAVIDFCLCSAMKYRYRAGFKNDEIQDLEKADWYLETAERLQKGITWKR